MLKKKKPWPFTLHSLPGPNILNIQSAGLLSEVMSIETLISLPDLNCRRLYLLKHIPIGQMYGIEWGFVTSN